MKFRRYRKLFLMFNFDKFNSNQLVDYIRILLLVGTMELKLGYWVDHWPKLVNSLGWLDRSPCFLTMKLE